MSKLDDWAVSQLAGIKQASVQIGRDIVSDVGSTYQAVLMNDAAWRVPRAHGDFTVEIAQTAEAAEIEEAVAAHSPTPEIDLEPE
jgi:hypothetical protein